MSHSRQRILYPAVVAIVFVLIVARSVFTHIDFVRYRVVRAPITSVDQTLLVEVPVNPERMLPDRVVLIATATPRIGSTMTLEATLDDRAVCTWRVRAKRQDARCVIAGWTAGEAHRLRLTSDAAGWQLDALEISTHAGRSNGIGDIVVLPIGADVTAPGLFLMVMVGVLAFAVAWATPWAWPRSVTVAHRVVVGGVALLTVACIVTPFVSPYRLLLSLNTAIGLCAMVVLPQLLGIAVRGVLRAGRALTPAVLAQLAAIAVAALVAAPYLSVLDERLDRHGRNVSAFIHINADYIGQHPVLATSPIRATLAVEEVGGYDGQFAYFEAYDPFARAYAATPKLYERFIDLPVYRYGRAGYVWLIWLASLGDWQRFPWAMLWLNLGAAACLAYLLARLSQRHGGSPLVGAVVFVIPAFWQSIFFCLPESIAALLLVAAITALIDRRIGLAALALAAALLIRETLLICVGLAAIHVWRTSPRRRDVLWLAASVLPWLAWRGYLAVVFWPAYGDHALLASSPVLGVPLGGMLDAFAQIRTGAYYPQNLTLAPAAVWLSLLLVIACVLALVFAWLQPNALTIGAAIYGVLAISLNYRQVWVHVGNAQRTTYEVFVLLAVMTTMLPRWRGPVWASRALWGPWGAAALYGVFANFDQDVHARTLATIGGVIAWMVVATIVARRAAPDPVATV